MKTENNIYKKSEWYLLSYDGRRKEFKGINKAEFNEAQKKAIKRRFYRWPCQYKSDVRQAYEYIKEWARPENRNYQKIAILGNTWLYACSPVYRFDDYNKARLIEVDGNEKKCDFLLRVSERISKGMEEKK